jgi:hypothetical protein
MGCFAVEPGEVCFAVDNSSGLQRSLMRRKRNGRVIDLF